MEHELEEMYRQLRTLSVFRSLHDDPVFSAFQNMLYYCDPTKQTDDFFDVCAAEFASELYQANTDHWTDYLVRLVLTVKTPCSHFVCIGEPIPAHIEQAARRELKLLSKAAAFSSEMAKAQCPNVRCPFPDWNADLIDLETVYFDRLDHIGIHGFGEFSLYKMFHMELSDRTDKGYVLEPVAYPDKVQLSDLIGYEMQRTQIIDNTRALLAGKKAANTLLYGDAGAGKSATVKAVANYYSNDGLRLIELSKNELHLLPRLLEELSANPLKFILFIDDLSFQENDDDFSALKAVLEGSISARSNNTVIFATSNRRHIVRETFSQRDGDEIHRNDTMQETISLSERFGIKVYFEKPNKELYIKIVNGLADQFGLRMDRETLALEAERFAMRKSGRSARAARQLVEQIAAKESLHLL